MPSQVAQNLLRDASSQRVRRAISEDGPAVSSGEASRLVTGLGANFTRSEVAAAIRELRSLSVDERGKLTDADITRLETTALSAAGEVFERPELDARPLPPRLPIDRYQALSDADRDIYDRAAASLVSRYATGRSAFHAAVDRGETGVAHRDAMNRLARAFADLNSCANRLSQQQEGIDEARRDASLIPNTGRYTALREQLRQFAH